MVVGPRVRSTNHHHDKLSVFPNEFVADRRFQQVAVIFNPLLGMGDKVDMANFLARRQHSLPDPLRKRSFSKASG